MKIIKRGAEAILYLEEDKLVKERVKKGYRISEIDDEIRKTRTKEESKLLSEARRCNVDTPKVFGVDGFKIIMEFIDGKRLKELINNNPKKGIELAEEIGKHVGLLHSHGIIHGDLTTSNMILKNNKLYFIDFGLGEFSKRTEKFGVDLSVLKEAFKSTHFKYLNDLWNKFIKGYKETNPVWEEVLKALEDIEKRGRYVIR
jgi:Kae1-associated kinase Bud32